MKSAPPQHSARKHSRISPSGLKSIQLCPGYEGIEGESDASLRGTALHEIMDSGIVPETPPKYLDSEDLEMARRLLATLAKAEAVSPYESIKEIELDFTPLELADFEKGHADRVIILAEDEGGDPRDVELIDFKFGRMEVESVKTNIQFRAYALGLFLYLPSVESIRVRIMQPFLAVDETHTLTRKRDYDMIVTQISAIVKRRQKFLDTRDPQMLKSDPDNCTFCAMQGTCPIWQAYQTRLANESNLFEVPVMPVAMLDDPELADPDEVVRVFRWVKPMEDYLKKVKRFALSVYDTGRLGPALTLVEKAGDANVVDILTVRDHLRKEYGISEEEFLSACSISLGNIKTLVGEKAPIGEKGKLQAQVITELSNEGLIQHGSTIRYLQLSRKKQHHF